MGKKGKTARLKRKPAPRFWPIHRKEKFWIVKPSSGPHSLENCLSLTLVLRDMLEVAETRKEGKFILSEGKVQVNGKIIKKDDFPVGLMDVISMPDSNKYYRIIPSHKGLILSPISKEEASYRIVRVEDKNTVKGAAQIIFHDGSIMLVKVADPKNPVEVTYETFDVLKITYDKQVVQTLKTREGNTAVITGGKNIGIQGKIVEIEKTEAKKRRQALVIIETAEGAKYQTILDYVFSISDTQQAMATPEANTVV